MWWSSGKTQVVSGIVACCCLSRMDCSAMLCLVGETYGQSAEQYRMTVLSFLTKTANDASARVNSRCSYSTCCSFLEQTYLLSEHWTQEERW